ncbi:MAG: phytanoyl-CoA dioxygenase family protein [Pseudomonadales bacterium]
MTETPDLKTDFDRYGYIAQRGFFRGDELAKLQAETARFITEVVPTLPATEVFYETKDDKSTLKQVQQLNQFDGYFHRLANADKVVGLAETLLGGPVSLKNTQYFNKMPGIGEGTPAHQDGYYFMIKPQAAVTMWLSLGHADGENGAVAYVPGSHKAGIRPHGRTAVLGFSQGISDWCEADVEAEQQMHAEAGDILVHHSLTIHRSNANCSQRDRKAVGFIFYRADVEIDEEAHAAYKARLNSDLQVEGKI